MSKKNTNTAAPKNAVTLNNRKKRYTAAEPYNWMANPPSINMLLGVWWLGELLYPQYCHFDMTEKTQEIFRTLWNYELSDAEAAALLQR